MFASWVWTQAGIRFRTALVADFHYKWGIPHRGSIGRDFRQARPGDVVLLVTSEAYYGHVGVIVRVSSDGKRMDYVAGNDGNAVRLHTDYPTSASDVIEFVSPMSN